MKLANTTCTISENVIQITENSEYDIVVNEVQEETELHLDIKISEIGAGSYQVDPHNHMTSTDVQAAIEELDATLAKQDTAPTSYEQGDLWYDTDDNELKVAREIAGEVQFRPLLSATGTMDNLDGGGFV
jgi:hypothetical protein